MKKRKKENTTWYLKKHFLDIFFIQRYFYLLRDLAYLLRDILNISLNQQCKI